MGGRLVVAAVAVVWLVGEAGAAQSPAPPDVTMTGCVSAKPDAQGRYTFADENGVMKYQLKGRRLSRYAGQRVELVGGAPKTGGGLSVRGGLVGPLAGARGVALDPAQESVRRQPGGGGDGVGPTFPELQVSRVKAVAGACETPPRAER